MAKHDSESNHERVRTAGTSGTVNAVIASIFIVMQLSIIGFVFHLHQELVWLEKNPPVASQEHHQNDYQQSLPAEVDAADIIDDDIHVVRQKRDSGSTISNGQFDNVKTIIDSYFENPSASSHLCLGSSARKYDNLSWTQCQETSGVVNIKNDNVFRFVSNNVLEVVRSGYYYIYLQLAAMNNTHRGSTDGWDRPHQCAFYLEVERARRTRARETLLTLQITRFGSSYTGGVFHLHDDDHLNVRPEVTNKRCSIQAHKEQSFFGMFILSPDDIYPPPPSYQHHYYRI